MPGLPAAGVPSTWRARRPAPDRSRRRARSQYVRAAAPIRAPPARCRPRTRAWRLCRSRASPRRRARAGFARAGLSRGSKRLADKNAAAELIEGERDRAPMRRGCRVGAYAGPRGHRGQAGWNTARSAVEFAYFWARCPSVATRGWRVRNARAVSPRAVLNWFSSTPVSSAPGPAGAPRTAEEDEARGAEQEAEHHPQLRVGRGLRQRDAALAARHVAEGRPAPARRDRVWRGQRAATGASG